MAEFYDPGIHGTFRIEGDDENYYSRAQSGLVKFPSANQALTFLKNTGVDPNSIRTLSREQVGMLGGSLQKAGEGRYANFKNETGIDPIFNSNVVPVGGASGRDVSIKDSGRAGYDSQGNKIEIETSQTQTKYPKSGETVGDLFTNPYTNQTFNWRTGALVYDPQNPTATTPQTSTFSLSQGTLLKEGTYNNESVKQLQGLLGVTQDGDFGPQTKAAVIAFQKANGLTPDGIVGPATTAALNKVHGGKSSNVPLPAAQPVGSGVPSAGATAPVFSAPTSGKTNEVYLNSVAADLESSRKTLENTYKKQIEDIQKKIDSYSSKEKDALKEVGELTEPFREDLEKAERERLYINQNFEANQKLTNELDSLLSEGTALIEQMRGVTGLAGIRNPRVNQAIEGVNARAGVIQAVMSARNNQISQAYTLIDRSLNAINADRKDQLAYYNSLLDFYGGEKSSLTADKKVFLASQIDLLQNDLKQSQATADYIKNAMIDPDTALAFGQAGVSLNDTPQQINAKLASYGYTKEVANMANEMAMDGFMAVLPGSKAPAGAQVVQTTDSKGTTKTYYKVAKASSSSPTSVTERKAVVLGSYAKGFNSGQKMPDGTPLIDPNGYVTPLAWKSAILDAAAEGVPRIDFIKQYGYLLYPSGLSDYGLTLAEQKIIQGALPKDEESVF